MRIDEIVTYDGRSSVRRRPAGSSDTVVRLYDLLARSPEGVTVEQAVEYLAMGFPTDGYRMYENYLLARRKSGSTRPVITYQAPGFQQRAQKWFAQKRLRTMVECGRAIRKGDVWFAGKPPLVANPKGRLRPYVAGSDPAKTAEGIHAVNMLARLRRLQGQMKNAEDREAMEWALRRRLDQMGLQDAAGALGPCRYCHGSGLEGR